MPRADTEKQNLDMPSEKIKSTVVQIKKLISHPNAEKLDIISFDVENKEIQLVVGKHYSEDEFGVFIPVGAIIPDNILDDMWLKGKLSGPNKNVVQGRKMIGIPSNGLFYGQIGPAFNKEWVIGQDVSEEMGIK